MEVNQHEQVIENHFNTIVDKLLSKKPPHSYSQKFNIKDLPDCQDFNHSPNIDPMFRYLFEELDTMDKHCLYWFEVQSEEKAVELNYMINEYRLNKGKEEYRSIPASNKNNGGAILYVGIRRGGKTKYGLTNIVGRINQHLGYYKTARTQGLQLIHCAKNFDCEITLNVVQFEDLQNNMYLNILEKKVAQRLKPLCGRH